MPIPPDSTGEIALSAFDRSPPARVPHLARALEDLGYRRYWMTEHRSNPVSPSPTILAAVAASVTSRIRVGTAGIMLRYASPLKVAEDFRLLEMLYPGRMDLGTVSGREREPDLDGALLDGRPDDVLDYEARFAQLVNLLRPAPPGDLAVASLLRGPALLHLPQLWACALREQAVRCAAARGIGFAYHLYLARQFGKSDGPQLVNVYRDQFQANAVLTAPAVAVVCFGACADRASDAEETWRNALSIPAHAPVAVGGPGAGGGNPGPDFMGSPEECRSQLEEIARRFQTLELVVHCLDSSLESQIHQYEILARAFELSAPSPLGSCQTAGTGGK